MKLSKIMARTDWGIDPVPEKHRILNFFDFFVLWGGLGVGLLVILAGSFLVPGLSFVQAFAAIILGSSIGCVLLALVGYIGAKTHLPTMVLLRSILGSKGSILPSFINIVQLIGWTIFEFVIMGYSADKIVKLITGHSNHYLSTAIFAFIVLVMALWGPMGMIRQWLKKFAIWVIILITSWLTIQVLGKPDVLSLLTKPGDGSMPFWAGVDLVIAMPISWLPLVADYNRFAKSVKESSYGTFAGYFIANVWLYSIGALLLLTTQITQDAGGFVPALLSSAGWLALLILVMEETKVAWADIYSAAVSTQNIFPKINQKALFVIFSIFSYIVAVVINIVQYENFLFLIGSVFISLFGILLADYFVIRRGAFKTKKGINWIVIVIWILGISIYQLSSRQYPGLSASLVSFASVFILYILIFNFSHKGTRFFKPSQFTIFNKFSKD